MTPSAAHALARLASLTDQLCHAPGHDLAAVEAGLESVTADLSASLVDPAATPAAHLEAAHDLRRLANRLDVLATNAQALYGGWLDRLALETNGYAADGRAAGEFGRASRRSLHG